MKDKISRSDFFKKLAAGSLGIGTILHYSSRNIQASPAPPFFKNDNFKVRGFHLDLRVEVMTVQALKNFAGELSGFGINAIIMEYEASYPYEKHATISNRYAYTRDEIKDFVSHCSSLGIDVIPLQECLGHVQYILRHERYSGLKVENSILSQIDPLNPDAISLFSELIEDLVSMHPSKYVHVGGDEVRHLDNPKYDSFIKKNGISKLYTQYMKEICRIVIDMGKQPLLWADMILRHPEAVADLPIDQIILVDWNYGWDTDLFGDINALQMKGCTFWGAPALRSSPDNYYITRWEKHFDNLKDFVPYSRKAAYEGIFMTSWSTSGIYSYQWEGNQKDVLDMFPIRNLYPLSGYRILVAAYARALETEAPLDPGQFVIQYSQQRFGLSESSARTLWHYFSHEQVLISRDLTVDVVLEKFRQINDSIHRINPVKNKSEFNHLLLIGDIREFYLSVKNIESMVESSEFDNRKMKEIDEELKPLLAVSKKLDESFISLNKGYLHDSELDRLNQLRNKRLHNLCDKYCH